MPQLSVIVPVYNVEPYIHRCVKSILSQSYSDFELILVDDGSQDNCGMICDEYALKDPRIRVIHQKNGGLSAARNSGLRAAEGEYIYFIDSDDYIESGLFEAAVEAMHDHDLVTVGCREVNENGEEIKQYCFSEPPILLTDEDRRFEFLTTDYFDFKIGFGACLHFYKKRIIDENSLFFEDNSRIFAEDLCFTFCYLLHADSVFCMPGIYYDYYQRSDSIMGVQSRNFNFGRMNELSRAVKEHIFSVNGHQIFKEHFPLIHMQVISNVLHRAKKNYPDLSMKDIRKIMLSEIEDFDYFKKECLGLKKELPVMKKMMGRLLALKTFYEFQYYASGRMDMYMLAKTAETAINIKLSVQ